MCVGVHQFFVPQVLRFPESHSWFSQWLTRLIPNLIPLVGSALAGWLLSTACWPNVGRKPLLITGLGLFAAGQLCSGLTNLMRPNYYSYSLIVTWITCGLSAGILPVVCLVHTAELAPKKSRGLWLVTNLVGSHLASLLAVGFILRMDLNSWLIYSQICCAVGLFLVAAIGNSLLVESPRWICTTRGAQAAMDATNQISRPVVARVELTDAINKLFQHTVISQPMQGMKWLFRACVPCLLLIFVRLFAGPVIDQSIRLYDLMKYSAGLFPPNASHDYYDWLCSLYPTPLIMQLLGAILIPLIFIGCAGRRTLTLISIAGSALSILSLGGALHYLHNQHTSGQLITPYDHYWTESFDNQASAKWTEPNFTMQFVSYIALLAITLGQLFYNIGLGTVFWVILAEVFPQRHRAGMLSILVTFYYIFRLILDRNVTDIYGLVGGLAGNPQGQYYVYGGLCVVLFGLLYVFLPETKDISLEDMEIVFSGDKQDIFEMNEIQMEPQHDRITITVTAPEQQPPPPYSEHYRDPVVQQI